ncbi:MAG: AhpC/TSA family protein [Cryomorphaceae bacterium]|nr:AhpC/TSA family protein [Cryomorphaceae bacterium]
MKYFRIFLCLTVVLSFTACDMFGPNNQVVIKGEIEGADKVIVVLTDTSGVLHSDTLDLVNGKFRHKTKIEEAEVFLLEFISGLRIPVVASPGDLIQVKANATNPMTNYEITGNKSSDILVDINSYMLESMALIDSLDAVVAKIEEQNPEMMMQVRGQLNMVYQRQVEKHREQLVELLRENPNEIGSIFILPQRLGQRELISVADNYALFEDLLAGLEENYKRSRHTAYLRSLLKRYERAIALQEERRANAGNISVGKPVPEIEMPDGEGKTKRLSETRGKVVLLDFWAAWCGPCRRANPGVVKIYEKYKNRGFTVFSVSLDGLPRQSNARKEWLRAIEDDNLSWPWHVSEVNGWNSSVVNTFAIEGIPLTLLIDKDGIIQGKNLQPQELEEMIEKLL